MGISTVFVGGVHGVGKSTLVGAVATALKVPRWTASEVIRAERADAVQARGKSVVNVDGNQDLLVLGFRRATSSLRGVVLLDGHFTLTNINGEIVDVPLETFGALNIVGVVLIAEDSSIIRERLLIRDGEAPSESIVEKRQQREREAAWRVASKLSTSLQEIRSGDNEGLASFIRKFQSTPPVVRI